MEEVSEDHRATAPRPVELAGGTLGVASCPSSNPSDAPPFVPFFVAQLASDEANEALKLAIASNEVDRIVGELSRLHSIASPVLVAEARKVRDRLKEKTKRKAQRVRRAACAAEAQHTKAEVAQAAAQQVLASLRSAGGNNVDAFLEALQAAERHAAALPELAAEIPSAIERLDKAKAEVRAAAKATHLQAAGAEFEAMQLEKLSLSSPRSTSSGAASSTQAVIPQELKCPVSAPEAHLSHLDI